MKANEAPDKIYLHIEDDKVLNRWNSEWAGLNDIEYTRTDAFIEKALEFLDGCIFDYIDLKHANVDTFMNINNKRFIEDFRNYMKK